MPLLGLPNFIFLQQLYKTVGVAPMLYTCYNIYWVSHPLPLAQPRRETCVAPPMLSLFTSADSRRQQNFSLGWQCISKYSSRSFPRL